MKIDRLLSIVIYLLNRDLVTARELADHFEVSMRTIQRDMEALTYAGIPVLSVKGPQGGFGIIEGYKLDRQIVDTDDLFFILTALESIGSAYKNVHIGSTLEKMKTLVQGYQKKEIERRRDQLYIDLSALGMSRNSPELFTLLEEAIAKQRLVKFKYTDSNYRITERTVEPMTIVFKWYAWYLFAFCRMRDDYRLFRLSRMEHITIQNKRFERRSQQFTEFSKEYKDPTLTEIVLKFHPSLKVQIEEYFPGCKIEEAVDGFIIITLIYPESQWLYGLILSYGEYVEVLSPPALREIIRNKVNAISEKYL